MWSWDDLGPPWGANAVHLSRWETGCGVNDGVHASSCPSLWHKTSKAIQYYGDVIYKLEELGDMSQQSVWVNVQAIHILSCTYLMKLYNSETNKTLNHPTS